MEEQALLDDEPSSELNSAKWGIVESAIEEIEEKTGAACRSHLGHELPKIS